MIRMRLAAFSLFTVALFFLGCGGGSKMNASISGKVTYKGAPIPGGTITFLSGEEGRFETVIQNDGGYSLGSMPPGTYTVLIETESANPNQKKQEYSKSSAVSGDQSKYGKGGSGGSTASSGGPKGKVDTSKMSYVPENAGTNEKAKYVAIPKKYATKSDLSVTLANGSNSGKDFDLKD